MNVIGLFILLALKGDPFLEVKTTGYCPGPPCVTGKWADGKTATNVPVRIGICAADWRVFPVGTVFFIPGYGICEVQDSGNAVKGQHLDLYFPTKEEAKQWGVQWKRVKVICFDSDASCNRKF